MGRTVHVCTRWTYTASKSTLKLVNCIVQFISLYIYIQTCIKQAKQGIIKLCLLKTGACLIQVHFNAFACFTKLIHACLIQVAC